MHQKKNLIKNNVTINHFNSFVNSKESTIPKNSKNDRIYNFKPILAAKKGDVTFCSLSGTEGKNLIEKFCLLDGY